MKITFTKLPTTDGIIKVSLDGGQSFTEHNLADVHESGISLSDDQDFEKILIKGPANLLKNLNVVSSVKVEGENGELIGKKPLTPLLFSWKKLGLDANGKEQYEFDVRVEDGVTVVFRNANYDITLLNISNNRREQYIYTNIPFTMGVIIHTSDGVYCTFNVNDSFFEKWGTERRLTIEDFVEGYGE